MSSMPAHVPRGAKCAARAEALWLDNFIAGLMYDDVQGSPEAGRHEKSRAPPKSQASGVEVSAQKVPKVPQSWQAPRPAGQQTRGWQVPCEGRPVSPNSRRELPSPPFSARRPLSAPQPRPQARPGPPAAVRQQRRRDWQCSTSDADPYLARAPDVHGAGIYALRDSRLAAALSVHADESRAMAAHRRSVSAAARQEARACAARRRGAAAPDRGQPEQPQCAPPFAPRPPMSPPPLHEAFRQKAFEERLAASRISERSSADSSAETSETSSSLGDAPPTDTLHGVGIGGVSAVGVGLTISNENSAKDPCPQPTERACTASEESDTYEDDYEEDFDEESSTPESDTEVNGSEVHVDSVSSSNQ